MSYWIIVLFFGLVSSTQSVAANDFLSEDVTGHVQPQTLVVAQNPISSESPATTTDETVNITNLAAGTAGTVVTSVTKTMDNSSQSGVFEFRPFPCSVEGSDKLVLDGIWRLNANAPVNCPTCEMNAPGWQDVHVPGQWANQGIITSDTSTLAVGTDFTIPDSLIGKRLFIRFDAVHGGSTYWLNGKKLGHTEYYYCPVEFVITQIVCPGETNHLRITQTRNLPTDKIQFDGYRGQGNPPETGIPRSVRVFALPGVHMSSLHIQTDLDDEYTDATLSVDFILDNPETNPTGDTRLDCSLRGPDGRSVPVDDSRFTLGVIQPGKARYHHALHITNPLKWNAETPNLYTLELRLIQDGVILERILQPVGFREIGISGSHILINGMPIKLHGVCHHESDPLTQRSGTARHAVADVLLMKYANVNYCRTTHYPPTKEFLDACDRYGIYVEVEAPFMWTRFVPGEDDPAFVQKFIDPTAAMLEYHRNHPSVFMWSLANESGFEPWHQPNRLPVNYQATNRFLKEMDPSRLTNFHNEWDADGRTTDIGNLHYVTPPYESSPWIADDTRPVLLGEMYLLVGKWKQPYLHLDPGIREYWVMENNSHWFNHMQKLSPAQELWATPEGHPHGQNNPDSAYNRSFWSEKIAGLSIWEAVGSHGIFDVWRRPKTEWWIVKRMFSPIQIPVRAIPFETGQTSITLPIENRFAFTDLHDIRLTWELSTTGVIDTSCPPTDAQPIQVHLPPMTKGAVDIQLPAHTSPGNLLLVRATHPDGHLITATGVRLGKHKSEREIEVSDGAPSFHDNGTALSIEGNDYGLVLDRSTGSISPLGNSATTTLTEFPSIYALSHWNQAPMLSGITLLSGRQERAVDALTLSEKPDAITIEMKDHSPHFTGHIWMDLDKSGNAAVSYEYTYSGEPFKAGEIGLCFPLRPDFRVIEWDRSSEWDVYPSDHIGRATGFACADRNPKITPPTTGYLYPLIPEYISGSPLWPCNLDSTIHGTDDFRATKYHINYVLMTDTRGEFLKVTAGGEVYARACLQDGKVLLNLWKADTDGLELSNGSTVSGKFMFSLDSYTE